MLFLVHRNEGLSRGNVKLYYYFPMQYLTILIPIEITAFGQQIGYKNC